MPIPGYIRTHDGVLVPTANTTIALSRGNIYFTLAGGNIITESFQGNLTSAAQQFAYYQSLLTTAPAAPTVTSITPNTCDAALGTTMEIGGTNFLPLASVSLVNGGTVVPLSSPIYDSDTKMHWSVYAGQLAPGTTYNVVYTGPDLQVATLALGFSTI